ncbi:MAG: TolC family protein [Geobacter sp.]|nr:TolC family protein [Geobacter sp.]
MRQTIFYVIIAMIAVLTIPPSALSAEQPPTESIPSLIVRAIADNPEIKASEARWKMFTGKIRQASSFEDPMLMLKYQNGLIRAPFDSQRDTMTAKVIGLSQQIPFWGKRGLKEEMAEREAESQKWAIEERKLELRRMVIETGYQIYFVDKSLEVVDKNIAILDDFITLAQTKYSVGQGAQQDVFKAQVERSRMLEMRISFEQQRVSLQAALNALLNRPAETPVGRFADFETTPVGQSSTDLLAIAEENRPQFKALRALIAKGEAGHRLAKKEYYPDFNVSFEYMQRDPAMGEPGYDMYSAGVTFNLPVQLARRQAMLAESSSEVRMGNEELNMLKNSIRSGIGDSMAQLDRRRRLIELYRTGIIPQAAQSLESATIGYRVNKVDFLTLLDNQVVLFNYEREYYESMAEYQMKRAQLEAIVGKELP